MIEINESQKIAWEVASLSIKNLPESGVEYHKRIWRAFRLGMEYFEKLRKEKKKKMKVIVLSANDDYWEGLFIDGELVAQAHELARHDPSYYIGMAEKYGFTSKDISYEYITDEDEMYLYEHGCFPNNIKELSGEY